MATKKNSNPKGNMPAKPGKVGTGNSDTGGKKGGCKKPKC